ncbi:GNAT family N-acetyltransferase [Sphaerisporangium sp. NPDC051017]|uniref:GNAT family N-acetyltransferase n=1 Tax=Sphaerisporangium sp. NPDC051017 TaxID=3154636 RepID=UPI00342D06DF
MELRFIHKDGLDAAEVVSDEYADVYLDIRAEAPYNSGPNFQRHRYLDRTRRQLEGKGFHLVAARDGDVLAGFAFGLTFPADRWWGGDVTPPPAEVLAEEKFAVIELNLRREYRGQGHGRRLLSELLQDRPEPWAMLLSLPAVPAHAMYEHWGWQVVGTVRPFPDADLADVMARPTPH